MTFFTLIILRWSTYHQWYLKLEHGRAKSSHVHIFISIITVQVRLLIVAKCFSDCKENVGLSQTCLGRANKHQTNTTPAADRTGMCRAQHHLHSHSLLPAIAKSWGAAFSRVYRSGVQRLTGGKVGKLMDQRDKLNCIQNIPLPLVL